MAHKPYIFISYSRRDEDRAAQLASNLESRLEAVLTERYHLALGREWAEALEEALRSIQDRAGAARRREAIEEVLEEALRYSASQWVLHRSRHRTEEELEEALRYSAAAIVCIGDHGLDDWQEREVQAALDLQIHRKLQLIPVLLGGSSLNAMPEFLRYHHFVDCRYGIDQMALDDLLLQLQQTFEERNLPAHTPAVEANDPVISQAYKVKRPTKHSTLALSQTRITFYLLVSALTGFILLSALTEQEVIVALGTLNIAIIGMWIWALLRKARALTQSLTPPKGDLPEV